MKTFYRHAVLYALALAAVALTADVGRAEVTRYDLAYIWDTSLESVLDYRDELADVFPDNISRNLIVVGRGRDYGVVYDADATAEVAREEIGRQAELLRNTDFQAPLAIKDHGYHRLYNVSYGLGPNLDVLKKRYAQLYRYLGAEVGRNLFIEKSGAGEYSLVYRRRGDRASTLAVARRHAALLRGKKISAVLTCENSNEVVYGESSLLDGADRTPAADRAAGPERLSDATVPSAAAEPASGQEPQPAPAQRVKSPGAPKIMVSAAPDAIFEENIEAFIKSLRRQGKIRDDEQTGWMVYDLASDTCLADINGSQVFQAASMIKPFIALAFFHLVKQSSLSYGPESRTMMEAMIQRSSNTATNWVLRRVGGPARCQQILRRHYGAIFKNTVISEYIPSGGRTYKNSAPPGDYIRFLRALWNLELPYSKELRRLMSLPGRDRIYFGTPIPKGTLVYNKTGTTAHICGDMGILAPPRSRGGWYPYALVGIIERSSRPADYGHWMLTRGNVIREVSTLVYEQLKKKHSLL